MLASVDDQRPEVRDMSFAAPDGVFVQFSRAQIPIGAVDVFEAMIFQTVRTCSNLIALPLTLLPINLVGASAR